MVARVPGRLFLALQTPSTAVVRLARAISGMGGRRGTSVIQERSSTTVPLG